MIRENVDDVSDSSEDEYVIPADDQVLSRCTEEEDYNEALLGDLQDLALEEETEQESEPEIKLQPRRSELYVAILDAFCEIVSIWRNTNFWQGRRIHRMFQ